MFPRNIPWLKTLRQPFQVWARSRYAKGQKVRLNQNRIFILPSRAGAVYIGVSLILLLIGMNYENNLVHAVAFLMLSFFILAILHTYSNLSGIEISAKHGYSCFAGEQAEFDIGLKASGRRERENIQLRWRDGTEQTVACVSTSGDEVRLFHHTSKRGNLSPQPLRISTSYPLGLLIAWSWLELDMSATVYPAPARCHMSLTSSPAQGDGHLHSQDEGEDFAGLEQYVPGMPLKHIAWKNYARGQGLHAKTFHTEVDQQCWFDWEMLTGLGTENRLSALCYLILQAEKNGDHYGLRIPGFTCEPGRGEAHRSKLLTALALFPGGAREA